MPTNNSTQSLSIAQPTVTFLRSLAFAFDVRAQQLYAEAEASQRYGNAARNVSCNARAIAYEDEAEILRLRAKRLADRRADEMEMMAEGYAASDIAVYVRRCYGTDGAK